MANSKSTQLIRLNNKLFWDWMSPLSPDENSGIQQYIQKLAKRITETGLFVVQGNENSMRNSTSIMEKLSLCMPREYFLEVQFCAYTYATILGKVFPPLTHSVGELAYIEWLLYVEPDYRRYRDHLVHMFKVAFTGDQFLSNQTLLDEVSAKQFESVHFQHWCKARQLHSIEQLWRDEENEENEKEKKEIVKIAFFIAALFHDFGYGYFFLRKYKERLHKLYRWLPLDADSADIHAHGTRKLLHSLPAEFVRNYHGWLNSKKNCDIHANSSVVGFFRDCLPLNHSAASTLFILDIAEWLWDSGALSQELYVAFQIAAEACLIHDMTGKDSWMHLSPDRIGHEHFLHSDDHEKVPLAYLLILADELSLWGRYSLISQAKNNKIIYALNKKNVLKEIKICFSTKSNDKKVEIEALPKNLGLKETIEKLKPFQNDPRSKDRYLLDYRIDVL